MNKLKRIACLSYALGGIAFADSRPALYENDFSTRTSAEPVASTNWVVTHYATNDVLLANNHNVSSETIGMTAIYPWQDGWFKMHRGKTYAANSQNLGVWYVRNEGGNAYASYSTKIAKSQTLHAQPIYNAITSGVIRTTFDMRIPMKVHENWSRLTFTLGTRQMMVESTSKADMVTTGTGAIGKSLFEVGFNVNNYAKDSGKIVSEAESGRVMGAGWSCGRDPTTGEVASKSGPWPAAGNWTRVIVEADLDSGTFDSRLCSLSTAHPTFDSTPGKFTTNTGLKFYTAYNPDSDGPITGLIVHNVYTATGATAGEGHYYLEDGYDDDYAFKMDNIKMEWKAPGASDFETFYLNDFNTSQRRTLAPAGTTSQDYAVATGASTNSYAYAASYVMPYGDYTSAAVTKRIVPTYNKAGNPVGYDGWRRNNGSTDFYITTCGVHRVLAMVNSSKNFGWLVHQLGDSPTSGKVKLEYDMRAPSNMGYEGWASACLGSKDDWANTANPVQYFRSGMSRYGTTDTSSVYPSMVGASWENGYEKNATTLLTSQYWYRMAITYNLDETPPTATMTCTEIGADPIGIDDSPSDGARTMTSATKKFLKTYKDFNLIVFGTYTGVSTKIAESVLVTNLKVTRDVGTESERVIYKNDFTTRTRCHDSVTTTRLTSYAHDRMFEGLDTWQRNNNSGLEAYVTADANPALMAAQTASAHGYYAQSIGGHYIRGTYEVRADFRVPDYWENKDGWCDVLFGNDMLKTGTMCEDPNGAYSHSSNYLLGMHLYPVSSVNSVDGLYDRTRFTALSGSSYSYGTDLTPGHWYRCVSTVYLSGTSKTTDMALYDMGTEHPSKAEALPDAPIAEVAGRPLYLSKRTGDDVAHLTTVGIRFRNTANYAFWKGEESGSPVIDNIVVRRILNGCVILVK